MVQACPLRLTSPTRTGNRSDAPSLRAAWGPRRRLVDWIGARSAIADLRVFVRYRMIMRAGPPDRRRSRFAPASGSSRRRQWPCPLLFEVNDAGFVVRARVGCG